MSVVFVVIPVVAGGWPIVLAAVTAASAALGYQATRAREEDEALDARSESRTSRVRLQMEDSEALTHSMARGESFTVQRNGLSATFRIDGRGQCVVHVSGEGRSEVELNAAGAELMDRVRQQFAYARVMEELETRGFNIVQEQVEADESIRIRVRRWS